MPDRRTALRRTLLAGMGLGGAALVGTTQTASAVTQARLDEIAAGLRAYANELSPLVVPTPTPVVTPTATAAPTHSPTPSPTATATVAPPTARARGLSYATDWDVTQGNINAARSVGARIIKISDSFPHRRTSDLSASELNRLAASLTTVRNAGMHAIVRFSYWYHWDGTDQIRVDAQPEWSHRHVDQLANVINANADIVLAVEAGHAGKWGEWHYHEVPSQFHTYGERSLSQSSTGARANLVRKLLDTYRVPVLFRYPRDIRWMWGFLNDSQKSRVGMHNDAVLTEPGEWGTWESGTVAGETDQQWLRRVFLSTPRIVGGEFAESTDYSDAQMVSAFQALAWRQYSFHSWDSGVPWGQDQHNPTDGIKAQLQRLGLWDDLVNAVNNGW